MQIIIETKNDKTFLRLIARLVFNDNFEIEETKKDTLF